MSRPYHFPAGRVGASIIHVKRALALLVITAGAAGCGGSDVPDPEAPPPPAATRDGRWIQDVDYMTSQLARLHPNLFFTTPRADFEAAAQQLKDQVPHLQDHEIVVGLMRVVALPGDAHTALYPWSGFHRLPLRFARLSDGFYVVAAEASLTQALGARLVAVGDVPVAALEAGAARLVSHENDAWVRHQAPDVLAILEVLFALGATPSVDGARVWLQQPGGALLSLDLPPRTSSAPLVSLTAAAGVPTPLHEQRTNENYWMTPLEGTRVIYVQYNRCQNGGEPFAAVAERLFGLLDGGAADRLIVDVRHNGGGDSEVDNPLIEGLRGRASWRARGRVMCLIGNATFSSAMWTAHDLQGVGATLVGSPTGGKPNSYGNTRTLLLPNSRVIVSYSTRHYQLVQGSDPPSVLPAVAVEPTIDDLRAGRDPVLEAALRFVP
jgi:hypothetical protein